MEEFEIGEGISPCLGNIFVSALANICDLAQFL